MTRNQKLMLVGLIALAVIVIAVLIHGQAQPACDRQAKDCAAAYDPGAGMKALGGVFGSLGSRVRLESASLRVAAGRSANFDVPKAGDESAGLRTLKLRLEPGSTAELSYRDRLPSRNPVPDDPQRLTLPRSASQPEDRRLTSFPVTHAGGTLTVSCGLGAACVVTVE